MPEALFLLVFTWYLLGILRLGKEKNKFMWWPDSEEDVC